MEEAHESVEKVSDIEGKDGGVVRRWLTEIKLHEKEFEEYHRVCDEIEKTYKNEKRKEFTAFDRANADDASFSILWSNVQTLSPALYSRTPKVEVERMFKDSDPLARLSSQVLERATDFQVKNYEFDQVMNYVVQDYLLFGRGVSRVRYIPTITDEVVTYEETVCEYVHRRDFGHTSARNWKEVRAVWFAAYLTRDELISRFGEEVGKACSLNYAPKEMKDDSGSVKPEFEMFKKAKVYEIWSKADKKTIWICEGYKRAPLDVKPDPLGLKDFFPCPRPLYATLTSSSLVPIPDFVLYSDQARELDVLTQRITALTAVIRLRGVGDAANKGLERILSEGQENDIILLDGWASFAQNGGLKGSIDWLPIAEAAEVLVKLYEARDRKLQEIYEITGLSDILRGNSNPNETATAQQIKGQFGTLRISNRQQEVQRFARDVVARKGEIVAERFQDYTLRASSGYDYMSDASPENPEEWFQIVSLLKNDPIRSYRIDIETDSTIAVNDQLEKEKVNELLASLGQFLQVAMPTMMQTPSLAPAMGELILLATRRFKAGRALEGQLEMGLQELQEQLQAPQEPPPPDPKQMEVEARMQLESQKLQFEYEKFQASEAREAQKLQLEAEAKAQELQIKVAELQSMQQKAQAEIEKLQSTLALEAEKVRGDLQLKNAELQNKAILETKKALREDAQFEHQVKHTEAQFQRESVQMERDSEEDGEGGEESEAPGSSPKGKKKKKGGKDPINLVVNTHGGRKRVVFGTDEMGNKFGEVIPVDDGE